MGMLKRNGIFYGPHGQSGIYAPIQVVPSNYEGEMLPILEKHRVLWDSIE
jgi:hypothetical protein